MSDTEDTVLKTSAEKQQSAPGDHVATENASAIKPPHNLDSKFGWLVVFGSFFNLMLSIGTTTTYGVYLQEYKLVEFPNVSSSFLSWIGTLQFVMMCFFGIGVGVLCEHVDTRILSAFGAIVSGVALIIASFCNSPWKLLLTQGILFGFGASFVYVTGLTLPPQWFAKYRAFATGIAIAGSGIGGLWLSFATHAIITNISWKWALRITGLIIIGVCGPISLLMKTRVKPAKRASGFYVPFFFMPSYAVIVLDKSDNWGTNIASIMNGASIAGYVLMGLVGDHIGALNTLCIATLLSCLSILVLWLPFKTVGTLVSAAVIFGIFSGAIVSMIPVVTANLFGVKCLPSVMGLLMIGYAAGGLISSPPAGHMLDTYGHGTDFSNLIIYAGVLLAVSFVLELVLRVILSRTLLKKF
ncbi:hypothetical protein FB639_003711 [Coemansia asiatica]|nr:hypothetical protein FB639_003711 [Coemansia asiatica]